MQISFRGITTLSRRVATSFLQVSMSYSTACFRIFLRCYSVFVLPFSPPFFERKKNDKKENWNDFRLWRTEAQVRKKSAESRGMEVGNYGFRCLDSCGCAEDRAEKLFYAERV